MSSSAKLSVKCGACQRLISAGTQLAGRIVKCPGCGASVEIPQIPVDVEQNDLVEEISPPSPTAAHTSSRSTNSNADGPAYHFLIDGKQVGPLRADGIRPLVASGLIDPNTMAWKQGMATWMPASTFFELFQSNAATPPLPPPPTSRSVRSKVESNDENPSRITAILLALLLGLFGAQWFYLKEKNKAIWYLLGGTVGWMFFLPPFVVALLSVIEGLTWLGWSDKKFNDTFAEQYRTSI